MTEKILTVIISIVVGAFFKPFADRLVQAIIPDPTKVIRLVKIFIILVFRYGTPIFFIVLYYLTYEFDKKFIILTCIQFLGLSAQLTIDLVNYLTRPYRYHIAVTRDLIDTQKQMQYQIQRTAESHIKLVDKIIDAFEGRNNNA